MCGIPTRHFRLDRRDEHNTGPRGTEVKSRAVVVERDAWVVEGAKGSGGGCGKREESGGNSRKAGRNEGFPKQASLPPALSEWRQAAGASERLRLLRCFAFRGVKMGWWPSVVVVEWQ